MKPGIMPCALLSALLSTCLTAMSATHNPKTISLLCEKSKILIEKNYIDKTTIPEISRKIDAICADKKISDIKTFIEKANNQLAKLDPHLQWLYYPNADAPKSSPTIENFLLSLPQASQKENFGFRSSSRLENNIGYLALDFFPPPKIAKATLDAAMKFIQHTDALVIDLRKNIGGDPKMVRYFASYFFPKTPPVLLNTIDWGSHKERIFTNTNIPTLPNWRYLNKPIYLLTSHQTFSAAEEFCYNLKQLGRAKIIGETTAGGANPGRLFPIDKNFALYIPIGKSINPYSNDNWEKSGITPDIKIAASQALDEALAVAKSTPSL
jgi:hypothetical protein